MDLLSFSSRVRAAPCATPVCRALRGFQLLIGSAAICVAFSALARSAPEQPQFSLSGSGTLELDQAVQKSGNVQIKAYLTPSQAAPTSRSIQEGGRIELTAKLQMATLVCYYDTIFRDDFDGDGF